MACTARLTCIFAQIGSLRSGTCQRSTKVGRVWAEGVKVIQIPACLGAFTDRWIGFFRFFLPIQKYPRQEISMQSPRRAQPLYGYSPAFAGLEVAVGCLAQAAGGCCFDGFSATLVARLNKRQGTTFGPWGRMLSQQTRTGPWSERSNVQIDPALSRFLFILQPRAQAQTALKTNRPPPKHTGSALTRCYSCHS